MFSRYLILLSYTLFGIFYTTYGQAVSELAVNDASTFNFTDTNVKQQFQHVYYWIDRTESLSPNEVYQKYKSGSFKALQQSAIREGLNPYPLWLTFDSKYIGDRDKTFWWNFFTHADSVIIYQWEASKNEWLTKDRLSYNVHSNYRKESIRFLSTEIKYSPNERKSFLAKIIHHHASQSFIQDFDIPKRVLLWEKDFYWSVGVFVGCSLMVLIYSLLVGAFSQRKIFFVYALYLLSIIMLCLKEELLSPVAPEWIFNFLYRTPGVNIVICCLGLNFYTIAEITRIQEKQKRLYKLFRVIVNTVLVWALMATFIYMIFFDKIVVGTMGFNAMWYMGLGMTFLLMMIVFVVILSVAKRNTMLLNIIAACLIIYFNPGGYFLNYEGIINYYEITYPNYFYWVLLLEFIVLGGILSWQYSQNIKEQKKLLNEKSNFEKTLYQRELEAEKKERELLAQDLHDELGGTLSAIKLFVGKHYKNDIYLQETVLKANIDVREFLDKLSDKNILDKGIFIALSDRIKLLNKMNIVQFSLQYYGGEQDIPEDDYVNLFWIANELFSNILKHSKAKEATVQIFVDEEQYTLVVEDDGIGMMENSTTSKGMGLGNIERRLKKMGDANIHVSGNSEGTTVILTKNLTT